MNVIAKSVANIARVCLGRTGQGPSSALTKYSCINGTEGSILTSARKYLESSMQGLQQIRDVTSLYQIHRRGGPHIPSKKKKNPLGPNVPFAKGVVLKTLIKKPKKPNSANRKCVLVRLSSGKEMTAYVPGIGHNLQEHNIVLVRVGRCKDVPGVKIKCVRGVYDLPHVVKQK